MHITGPLASLNLNVTILEPFPISILTVNLRQRPVCSSRMQVKTKSKRDEIPTVRRPKLPDLGMYLFSTINCIVESDAIQYSTRLLYSK